MKSVRIARFGGPSELVIAEVERPKPAKGQILVRLAYSGINFIDVYMRNGSYARSHTYDTALPMILGMEGAGTVVEIGQDVEGFVLGDRVAYCLARGSYAQYATVPGWRAVKIPDEIPLSVATALMLQGSTAHYLTHSAFALASGQTCLVHAGAGGVGQLLIQLAKLRGASVIATVGSEEKAGIAKSRGADHTILYHDTEFREAVMDITRGQGVDVVYDSVGRDTIDGSIRSLRRRGLCILFGASSGQVSAIEPLALAEAGSVYFTRPHLADYTASADEVRWRATDLFKGVADGEIHVSIDQEFSLLEAQRAHQVLEARGSKGKCLLRIDH